MKDHESYEILCAVAASGRASTDELKELSLHLEECGDCRNRLAGFAQVSAQALPLHADAHDTVDVPSGMTARFVERGQAEGIALSRPLRLLPHWLSILRLAWTAAAAVVFLAGLLSIRGLRVRPDQVAQSQQPAGHVVASPQESTLPPVAPVTADRGQLTQLRSQLVLAQGEIARLQREIIALQRELKAADYAQGGVSSRLATAENDNANLRLQMSAKESRVADLDRQLKQKDSLTIEGIASLAEKQAELEKLSARLSEHERELEHERQLLAASAQARDLITARNLHIVDVHDNDRAGRQRPFGRIFYTEGQSLIFYAYDLDPSGGQDTKVAFHVWGGTLGDKQHVKNLGIFRSEASAVGRWVLTFDDPRVLAQINTVFVTAESAKNNSDQPKGKRILYAFLGDHPNHP